MRRKDLAGSVLTRFSHPSVSHQVVGVHGVNHSGQAFTASQIYQVRLLLLLHMMCERAHGQEP